jgi:hypothetical protein
MHLTDLEFYALNIYLFVLFNFVKQPKNFMAMAKEPALLICCTIFVQVFRNELCTKLGGCLYSLVIKWRCFNYRRTKASTLQDQNSKQIKIGTRHTWTTLKESGNWLDSEKPLHQTASQHISGQTTGGSHALHLRRSLHLTHCGRVTKISVFNTVKLGTSASSS